MSHLYKIAVPPSANWRWRFGDSTEVYFEFYIAKPPNRLQRWLTKNLLGICWEPVPPTTKQL